MLIEGWRRNQRVFGKPDFIFPRQNIAIFTDGCFWHSCPKHSNTPVINSEYWKKKLEYNRQRDKTVNRELRKQGWNVIRIWEHELKNENAVYKRLKKYFPDDNKISRSKRSE
jgi:DNA mismatch endonuclease (patch repair protein)